MIPDYVPQPVLTLFGETIAGTITGVSPHDWWADTSGLFHTDTDLTAEWKGLYQQLLAGTALTAVQHLEANAEAVFENTKLATLSVSDQARDREDAQREFDAIAAAMTRLGMDGTHPLTVQDYLSIGRTVQSDTTLQELSIQGHGLNSPPSARYNGYTNDFQNNVDGFTLFIGAGLDSNQNALRDFFDDVIISHLPFPVVAQDGHLEQLNQNADSEDVVKMAVGALDDAMFTKVWTAKDFSVTPGTASATPDSPPDAGLVAGKGTQLSLFGDVISSKATITSGLTAAHVWTADSNGLYHTTTNLAAEWVGYYHIMLAGNGDTLTAIQRAEGNAEAVFENTALGNIVKADAAASKLYREDVQRELDGIAAAAASIGWDGHSDLTVSTYRALEHALQDNPLWLELAMQGHGLNSPSNPRYNGFTYDFQNNIDSITLFVGGGLNTGEFALADFMDDSVLSHLPFPVVAQNGELEQLNQNGRAENTLNEAVDALNTTWLHKIYTSADFMTLGTGTVVAKGDFIGYFGAESPRVLKAGSHTWVAGSDGLYHTATDLGAEWQKYYKLMLAGKGNTLTAVQRWEGNAEAVFENSSLSTQQPSVLARDREDVQRVIDAVSAEMTQLGLTTNALLSTKDYLNIIESLQADTALRELALQGEGLNNPSMPRYNGFTNDMMWADWQTYFVGGGVENGQNVLSAFFDDQIIGELAFPVIAQNGQLVQLNQNGNADGTLQTWTDLLNTTLFKQVYVASDFSKVKTAVGAIVLVPGSSLLTTPVAPVAGAGQMTTLFGDIVSTTQVLNGHTWVADSTGLYHTTTDLTLEWYNLYQQALAGAALTGLQHLEANAEAVFENTGLNDLNEQVQERDREDFQRELDVIATAMGRLGLSTSAPMSAQAYLSIQHVIELDGALHEMALQGHGLNSPPASRYRGYTNDFQNNVDQRTLYIGGGLNTGERAIADLFDDRTISHLLYPVVAENGELVQLNQNGANENTLLAGLDALNQSMFSKLYLASDFVIPGSGQKALPVLQVGDDTASTAFGQVIAGTIVANGHTWVADANGQYHTLANLEIEWRTYYQQMLAGNGASLTAVQRLEGNAEAVFENTLLGGGPDWLPHSYEMRYREDVQRMLDAIGEAMHVNQATFGTDPTAPLTIATYMALAHTIQGTPTLGELALQGLGMASPVADRYNGYTIDVLRWGSPVDSTTLYVGGGLDNNMLAVQYLMVDGIMSQLLNPVIYNAGQLTQDNNHFTAQDSLNQAVVTLDDLMYFRKLHAADFSTTTSSANAGYVSPAQQVVDAASAAKAPAGSFTGLYGDVILKREVISTGLTAGHTWMADANGVFHTATDLGAEWKNYYAQLTAGKGKNLSAIQRLEANAEAVFENTAIKNGSAAQQVAWREDVQRALDAMAAAMKLDSVNLGIDPNAQFTEESYLDLEHTIQGNAVLNELYMQGHGLTGAAGTRYAGYVNDFRGLDSRTLSLVDYSNAVGSFMDHFIIGNLAFGVEVWNWNTAQLNEAGTTESSLFTALAQLNTTIGGRVLRSYDFRH